jgi:hypothetical protein
MTVRAEIFTRAPVPGGNGGIDAPAHSGQAHKDNGNASFCQRFAGIFGCSAVQITLREPEGMEARREKERKRPGLVVFDCGQEF